MVKRDGGPILGGEVDIMKKNAGSSGLSLKSRLGLGCKLELGL